MGYRETRHRPRSRWGRACGPDACTRRSAPLPPQTRAAVGAVSRCPTHSMFPLKLIAPYLICLLVEIPNESAVMPHAMMLACKWCICSALNINVSIFTAGLRVIGNIKVNIIDDNASYCQFYNFGRACHLCLSDPVWLLTAHWPTGVGINDVENIDYQVINILIHKCVQGTGWVGESWWPEDLVEVKPY